MVERVPTGIAGLDPLIEGGLPKGMLLLLAGAPGTGKTSMCCKFLEKGASTHNEKGLYVSFLESKETLMGHLLHQFGPEFSGLVKEGQIQVLAFPSMKREGVPAIMDAIMTTIKDSGVKRFVIDSVTALYESFTDHLESRIFTHTVLTKLIPTYGCTTLIIKEMDPNEEIGKSSEDFVVDGIVVLRRLAHERRILRELEIAKLRGTRLERTTCPFTLEGGFTVFPQFSHKALGRTGRLEPIPDSDSHFSTGHTSVDQILWGGYPRGSMVLLETGPAVPMTAFGVLSYSVTVNFLNQKSSFVGIQSLGVDPSNTQARFENIAGENAVNYARHVEKAREGTKEKRPFIIVLKGEDPRENVREYLQAGCKLRQQTGRPVLWWVSLDHFVDIFSSEYAEKALSELSAHVIRHKDLAVVLAKPGLEHMTRTVSNMAATHLRVFERDGSLLLYGEKPRTLLYGVTVDPEKGIRSARFTPIV